MLCPMLEESSIQSGKILLLDANNNQPKSDDREALEVEEEEVHPSGSILPTYYFAHDRIQQAAASLMSKNEQLQVHLHLAEVSICLCPVWFNL